MKHLADQQGGVIHVGQLRQKYRWERISTWVRTGRLTAIGRGWLQVPDAGSDLQARFTRAQTQIGEPIIACSFSAARFFGINLVDDGKLHVTTASGHSVSVPRDVVLHQAPPRSPISSWPGMRVTDRADTVVDVATAVGEIDVLAVLDAAAVVGLQPCQVAAALERAARRRGVVQVRRWLPYLDCRSASPMESRTRARLLAYGLPAPDLQIRVLTSSGVKFLDLGWEQYRVGADYEGQEFHTGDGRMSKDRRRHNAITDGEWRMFYPTARDIYTDYRAFASMVERALRAAGWQEPLHPLRC